jgi:hypothetical protein
VFFVDWSVGSSTIFYSIARERVNDAGRATADFIKYLVSNHNMDLNKLTLVGLSLGGESNEQLSFLIITFDYQSQLMSLEKQEMN